MEQLTTWGSTIFVAILPGILAAVLWSPILISQRLRALFRRLPLTDSLIGGYVIVAIGLSFQFVAGVWLAAAGSTHSVDVANALLNVALGITVLYLCGLPLTSSHP